jgi:GDP-L-fucose synthase
MLTPSSHPIPDSDGFRLRRAAPLFLAGHQGLIGSAFFRRFQSEGFSHLLTRTRNELDLTNAVKVREFFESQRPEVVILCAGKVGGILANRDQPAEFISENLSIQLNVIEAAFHTGAKRVVVFGSSCMYPKECGQPMSEDLLLTGKPEATSLPYAISKLAGLGLCLAYNQQYRSRTFLPVIPNNTFGPNDNFDPSTSHVLSALISRFHTAKSELKNQVTLWGTGEPRREFIYADDVADACLFLLERGTEGTPLPVNIGSQVDYSIRELADQVASVVGYQGRIEFDSMHPDGAPRKLLDTGRMNALGWKATVSLKEGLQRTYDWFLSHFPRRG